MKQAFGQKFVTC